MSVLSSTRRRTAAVLVVGVLLVVAGFTAVQAANPTSGTVSDSHTSTSWGGGPFTVANASGNATGTPVCPSAQACDDFKLTVSTPAGYGDTHNLVTTVRWPDRTADFDVYVLDAAGNVVGQSASSADPEKVVLPPTSGVYTVRVVPYLPLGQSYTAVSRLVTKPTPPPVGTAQRPRFHNYVAPKTLPNVNNAGEPSIGTAFKSASTYYQAYFSTYKVLFDNRTTPATAHWSNVSASASNGCAGGSTKSLDPILFTDHRTGRTFESQLTALNSLTCYTDDGGKTWNPTTGGGIPSGVDHQTIGGGPYPAGSGSLPTSTYPHSVYYCSQDIATAFCAASHDGGATFGNGVPTYNLNDCGGLHGHLKVAPDGTAYLPNKSCGSGAGLVVSTDNGQSWTVHDVPGTSVSDADPSVGVGANGTVYFGYVGADGKPGVAVSHDKGQTWVHNQPLGTEFHINNAVFPAAVAGDDNRAAVAFIGTPKAGNYQSQTTFRKAVWHLYVSTTYDGGRTWQTTDATPHNPVQRGSICTGGTTCGNDRNLLDFIDATIDGHGRVEVAYADGCIKTCVTNANENSDAVNNDANSTARYPDATASYATIARQSSGRTLFAAYDPRANLRLARMTVAEHENKVERREYATTTLVVRNTSSRTVRSFDVAVSDHGRVVHRFTGLRLAAGRSRTLTFVRHGSYEKHTFTGSVDPSNRIAESNEGDNKRSVLVRE